MLEPGDVIDLFFNHIKTRTVSLGEVIFNEGEKGEVMYALIKGTVDLKVDEKVVETIYEHDVFGEGALVQLDHSRSSTAIARTECQIGELNKERFLFLVQETPIFALEVIRSLSTRLRKLKHQL